MDGQTRSRQGRRRTALGRAAPAHHRRDVSSGLDRRSGPWYPDPRRRYTFSSDHVCRASGPTSDYHVTHNITAGRLRIQGTRFAKTNTGTNFDFRDLVKATPVPLVAHELGQWVTFPSYGEIAKYTGVLKARNLEVFRDALAERGMSDQAAAFQEASGKFAWRAYKEDMETALRTPDLGGFQLLQLQDFPGQGEALIGLLDSFWDSKGILTPEEFRRFCSQTVPLRRMNKFVWTNNETFTGTAQVAHYGFKPAANAAPGSSNPRACRWAVSRHLAKSSSRCPASNAPLA